MSKLRKVFFLIYKTNIEQPIWWYVRWIWTLSTNKETISKTGPVSLYCALSHRRRENTSCGPAVSNFGPSSRHKLPNWIVHWYFSKLWSEKGRSLSEWRTFDPIQYSSTKPTLLSLAMNVKESYLDFWRSLNTLNCAVVIKMCFCEVFLRGRRRSCLGPVGLWAQRNLKEARNIQWHSIGSTHVAGCVTEHWKKM